MAPAYVPPAWGAAGVNACGVSLEVIKGGVVVEALSLPLVEGKSFVVVGRMEPACDLVLQHPSISRVHAALQFDAHGVLFLRDMGSTHGTFVNKKRLPAHEFARLNIGDVVAFGESTRLYAVCGPQELLPPERKPSRRCEVEDESKVEEAGVSWGFGEDAQEEDDKEDDEEDDNGKDKHKEQLPDYLRNLKEGDTPYKSTVKKAELNEKDQRLFQQLQAKITKMENLKQEKSRILAKQHQLTGLTEGQQQQLVRNEQRIEALLGEIEDTEEKIHAKNAQREQTAAKSAVSAARKKTNVNEALYSYDSDEDDFYDRTRSNQQRHEKRKQQVSGGTGSANQPTAKTTGAPKAEILTASAIEAKIRILEDDLVKVKEQLSAVELEGANKVADEGKEEEIDSLDSFMNATSKQLVESDRDAVARRKDELEKELARQRQFLAIATPALSSVATKDPKVTTQIKETPVSAKQKSQTQTAQVSSPTISKTKPSKSQEGLEGKESGSSNSINKAAEQSTLASSASFKGPPSTKVSRNVPHDNERSHTRVETAKSSSSERTRRDAVDEPVRESKKRRVVGPMLPPALAIAEVVGETSELEGGDRAWVPPKNQTGDGRTALNDKFGY